MRSEGELPKREWLAQAYAGTVEAALLSFMLFRDSALVLKVVGQGARV